MYFENFPLTYYTVYDDLSNVKIVTNITVRSKLSNDALNNLLLYDEYDIKDGETPEIVADKFYNNPQLHWVVLLTNEIIDPRFDWLLSINNLYRYCEGKYDNVYGVHHYEDNTGNISPGNVILTSNSQFGNMFRGNVVINNAGSIGVITSTINASNVFVLATSGGFTAGEILSLKSNSLVNANISSTVTISGTPVSNYSFEDKVNEAKRRIKILKPQYVNSLIDDFKRKLET